MKLTAEMAQRYDDGKGTGVMKPCIVCGVQPALKCDEHYTSGLTIEVCKRLKNLGKAGRDKLKAGKL